MGESSEGVMALTVQERDAVDAMLAEEKTSKDLRAAYQLQRKNLKAQRSVVVDHAGMVFSAIDSDSLPK